MSGEGLSVTVIDRISAVTPAEWNACAAPECADGGRPMDPFTTWAFLAALEESRSVGPGTGWTPRHLVVRDGAEIIAVAPAYLKSHSMGEYVFDHAWAQAWERAGGRYYPKLQVAVPFTPATGRRFLTRPGAAEPGRAALLQGLLALGKEAKLSSAHVTFCTKGEADWGAEAGLLRRASQQFHWMNAGYADYEGFLATLASRKRKALRKERAAAQGFGGEIVALTGDALRPAHWDAFWHFYQDTGARKWGQPYLTRAFFSLAQDRLRNDVLMVLALRDGRPVAGALNFIGRTTLYGRYWGAVEHHPFLHFELCYHQAIDWAIAQGLTLVEAGAQGEHKLARGYLPVITHSLHWIADPGFRRAVADYLDHETRAIVDENEDLSALGPFRRGPAARDTT